MAEASALEELLKLRQSQTDREAKLFTLAKEELMTRHEALRRDFAALGIAMPGGGGRGATAAGPGTRRARDPQRPCDACGFATVPPHDVRHHRGQGKNRRPFTAHELRSRGMAELGEAQAAQ